MFTTRDFLIVRNRILRATGLMPNRRAKMNPYKLPESRRREGARAGLALVAIIKDERPYLEEWIAFHAMLGASAVYVYDNGSTDEGPAFLRSHDFGIPVTCLPWWSFDGIESTQVLAYAHALANFGADHRWMAFLDVDEFMMPAVGADLPATLAQFERQPGVTMPWISFGPNGHREKPDGLVIENYTERAAWPPIPAQFNLLRFKAVVDPAEVEIAGCHEFGYRGRGVVMINEAGESIEPLAARSEGFAKAEILRLHHYFSRSEAEMAAKLEKGRVSENGRINRTTYARRIEQYRLSTHRDETALRFVAPLNARLTGGRLSGGAAID
ncbi:MAG: glycosyltransferase family 2 protein [Pseudomonadota bacterium]